MYDGKWVEQDRERWIERKIARRKDSEGGIRYSSIERKFLILK